MGIEVGGRRLQKKLQESVQILLVRADEYFGWWQVMQKSRKTGDRYRGMVTFSGWNYENEINDIRGDRSDGRASQPRNGSKSTGCGKFSKKGGASAFAKHRGQSPAGCQAFWR